MTDPGFFIIRKEMVRRLEGEISLLQSQYEDSIKISQELADKVSAVTGEIEQKTITIQDLQSSEAEGSNALNSLISETEELKNNIKTLEKQGNFFLTQFEGECSKRSERFLMGPTLHKTDYVLTEIQKIYDVLDQIAQKTDICSQEIQEYVFRMAEEAMVLLSGSGNPPEEVTLNGLRAVKENLEESVEGKRKMLSEQLSVQAKLEQEMESL